jgi:hypothetical protein
MTSSAASVAPTGLSPERPLIALAQIIPAASTKAATNARIAICLPVGAGPFDCGGTEFSSEFSFKGAPQPTQALARVLIARPHSLQRIMAIKATP